jgi:hypothetical protein
MSVRRPTLTHARARPSQYRRRAPGRPLVRRGGCTPGGATVTAGALRQVRHKPAFSFYGTLTPPNSSVDPGLVSRRSVTASLQVSPTWSPNRWMRVRDILVHCVTSAARRPSLQSHRTLRHSGAPPVSSGQSSFRSWRIVPVPSRSLSGLRRRSPPGRVQWGVTGMTAARGGRCARA